MKHEMLLRWLGLLCIANGEAVDAKFRHEVLLRDAMKPLWFRPGALSQATPPIGSPRGVPMECSTVPT